MYETWIGTGKSDYKKEKMGKFGKRCGVSGLSQ